MKEWSGTSASRAERLWLHWVDAVQQTLEQARAAGRGETRVLVLAVHGRVQRLFVQSTVLISEDMEKDLQSNLHS